MSRRRIIGEEINQDPAVATLSLEAWVLFVKFLSISDDYGIVPLNSHRLRARLHIPERIDKNFPKYLGEIISASLGGILQYKSEEWFFFKPESFYYWQSCLISRRTKSEYLKLSGQEVIEAIRKASEAIAKGSASQPKPTIESRKYKVESIRGGMGGNSNGSDPTGPHLFKNSPFTDLSLLEKALPQWPHEKVEYYYRAALDYSASKGAKYIDWVAAIRNWDRKNPREWQDSGKSRHKTRQDIIQERNQENLAMMLSKIEKEESDANRS